MRTLKQIRLVYRQHLLPPLIVPFQKLTKYKNLLEERTSLKSQYQTRKQMLQIHQINETVITQIIKIKNNFILPIQKCPFYYEELDKYVRELMQRKELKEQQYLECLHSLTATERRKIHQEVNKNYRIFKENLEKSYPDIYKNITYIPLFIFQSPSDLALYSKKKWNQLSDLEKVQIKERYESKLSAYWKSLNQIAHRSSIQADSLLELMKNQINPPLSSGLKQLLFPSQQGGFAHSNLSRSE